MNLLKTPMLATLALAVALATAPTGAEALSKKDRQLLTGIGVGLAVGAVVRKGRDERRDRQAKRQTSSMVDQGLINSQFVFEDMPSADRSNLQRKLRSAGYYNGGIDAAWGRGMTNAFMHMFSDNPRAIHVTADPRAAEAFLYDLARG